MADKPRLLLSSSPSIYSGMNVQRLMLYVIISLLPVSGYGIYLYGIPALTTILVSVVSCVGFEVLFRKLIKAPGLNPSSFYPLVDDRTRSSGIDRIC